jgi:PAS domain S-box-containing protein
MTCKPELQEALNESYEQYRQLIESSPVAMGSVCDDTIVFVNNAGSRLFGAAVPSQIIGKKFFDFLHADYQHVIRQQFQQVRESKKAVTPFDVKIRRLDGKDVDVEITGNYFTFQDKAAVQFALHEITERKKMEELIFQSKQDWEDTFHTMTDMITVHDKDFNIVYANKAAQDTLKLPAVDGNATRKCFTYYHGTECPPEGCPSCNCLKTGAPANFEIFEPHLNMFIEIRSMPRFDKSVSGQRSLFKRQRMNWNCAWKCARRS